MYNHQHFEDCFEGFRNAAKDFGEYVKNMADEGGWAGKGHPFEHGWGGRGERWFADILHPRVNIYTDSDRSLVFEFMLAGYDEKSIHLSFKGDTMVLTARVPDSSAEGASRRYEQHRFWLKDIDHREYPVPADRYDQNRVRATHKNGILTVTVPRREDSPETEGVKVDIQSGEA